MTNKQKLHRVLQDIREIATGEYPPPPERITDKVRLVTIRMLTDDAISIIDTMRARLKKVARSKKRGAK